MSGSRAAIARLSLAIRILLYAAFLFVIGYLGFSYNSGFVALPGDFTLSRVSGPPGQPGAAANGNVVFFRLNCVKVTSATVDIKPADDPASGRDCATAAPAGGKSQFILHLFDDSNDITIERDGTGPDAKGHVTLKTGGKTIEADMTGTTLPDAIAAALQADKRAKIEAMLKNQPPAPGPQQFVLQGTAPAAAPPGMTVQVTPGHTILRAVDGSDEITIDRDGTGPDAKSHITLKTGGKTIEADMTGTTLPDAIAGALPADKRAKIEAMLKNQPPAPGQQQIILQGAAPAGGVVVLNGPPPAGGVAPFPPGAPGAPVGGAVQVFSGPVLLQQQLRGHTATRATLVGITIALVILAIVQLERLLAHFQSAELFSTRNSGLLRNIGLLLVAIAIVQAASTLLPALLVKALSPLLIGALGPHLFLVFAGLVLILLAQVMAEASRLEDEAAHTV